jgi:hypothetical protein
VSNLQRIDEVRRIALWFTRPCGSTRETSDGTNFGDPSDGKRATPSHNHSEEYILRKDENGLVHYVGSKPVDALKRDKVEPGIDEIQRWSPIVLITERRMKEFPSTRLQHIQTYSAHLKQRMTRRFAFRDNV